MAHSSRIGLSRRHLLQGGSAAVLAASGGVALGAAARDWQSRLAAALRGADAPDAARFDILRLSIQPHQGGWQMQTVVRMTWQPGMRQRLSIGAAADPESAFAALLDEVDRAFDIRVLREI